MKTLKISNLEIDDVIDRGSFSDILKCKYKGSNYAYKAFYKPQRILTESRKRKINKISEIDLNGSILPKFWVRDGMIINGYLMDLHSYVFLEDLDNKDKIKCLKEIKNSILELHENKIIHGDIHDGNIIYNEKESFLLDFDNSSYKNRGISYKLLNKIAKEFVDRYGITSDLDIFLFNALTYSLFTDIAYYKIVDNISKVSTHGIFVECDCSDIIKSLTLKEKTFNNDFLIDRIK